MRIQLIKSCGFSLAELLIALLILGQIATFTIPKVLSAQENSQKKAVFRETLATISSVLYQCAMTQEMWSYTQMPYGCLAAHINHLKGCPTNFNTQGCYTAIVPVNDGGLVLHNGAVIVDIYTGNTPACADTGCGDGFVVDWNGDKGPNVYGDDQLSIGLNYGGGTFVWGVETIRVGQIFSSDPLYEWVFTD